LELQRLTINLKPVIYFIFAGLTFVLTYFYFNYNPNLISLFPKCPFYTITGFYCPGCGSQRAVHQFLHGHILEGLKHNFLILILVSVLTYDGILFLFNHFTKKPLNNLLHQSRITKLILIIILSFWVLRNIDFYPFTILAP
jgi:hypothetical protein